MVLASNLSYTCTRVCFLLLFSFRAKTAAPKTDNPTLSKKDTNDSRVREDNNNKSKTGLQQKRSSSKPHHKDRSGGAAQGAGGQKDTAAPNETVNRQKSVSKPNAKKPDHQEEQPHRHNVSRPRDMMDHWVLQSTQSRTLDNSPQPPDHNNL